MSPNQAPQDSGPNKTTKTPKTFNWVFWCYVIISAISIAFIGSKTDRNTALTAALVLGTFTQAWIYFNQAKLMRESIDKAKESSESQLRAYITFTKFEREGVTHMGEPPTYYMYFKNTGQTPAYRVIGRGSVSSIAAELPKDFRIDAIAPELRSGNRLVGSQDTILIRCEPGQHHPAQPPGMALYILGRVEYTDAFKKSRYTNFCFSIKANGCGINPTKRGNDTDDYPDD